MKNLKYKILLGSQSPRRKELLEKMDIKFRIVKINFEEKYPKNIPIAEIPEFLALQKSKAYSKIQPEELLITADTLVILEKEILEKPRNKTQARKMLQKLSGKKHKVITGVCLRTKNNSCSFSDISKVYFKKLSPEEINYYVDTYKPMDKAGAYGIQEWIGLIGIKKIKGSYFNIMGFPTEKFMTYVRQCK